MGNLKNTWPVSLPPEGGVEIALEHKLGKRRHSQGFDFKSSVTVG